MDAYAFKEQSKYYNALLGPGKASKARSPKKDGPVSRPVVSFSW